MFLWESVVVLNTVLGAAALARDHSQYVCTLYFGLYAGMISYNTQLLYKQANG
jgi:hypothetical protein